MIFNLYFKAAGLPKVTLNKAGQAPLFTTLRHIIAYQMFNDGVVETKIAQELNYKDHTTVSYAVIKIDEQLKYDETVKSIYEVYSKNLSRYKDIFNSQHHGGDPALDPPKKTRKTKVPRGAEVQRRTSFWHKSHHMMD